MYDKTDFLATNRTHSMMRIISESVGTICEMVLTVLKMRTVIFQ